jgi:putative transposase
MVSAPARRQQVTYAQARGLSSRIACALMQVSRSALKYQALLPVKDAPVLALMHELSAQYPRFGYRRIGVYLERAGHVMSWDRTHRLWKLAGLQVPRKRPRKRIASSRPRPLPATGANQVWAYDFVFDACASGQQLKCLTVIDEWTRESLAIDVQGSIRSGRVIEVLSQLISVHGAPLHLRSDNGPEFVSRAVLKWLHKAGINTALSDPGKPWQNGSDESFNGKFRDECLSMEWFRTRPEARVVIEVWRKHYNVDRPHSSLDYVSPWTFKQYSKEKQNDILQKQERKKKPLTLGAILN